MQELLDQQLKGFEPGIYFGLPEQKYHADPALSRGDIVKLLVHYYDYWVSSAYNPDRESKFPTAAMKKGTNKHMYLLEPELFKKTYRSAMEAYDKVRITLSRKEYDEIVDSVELLAPIYDIYFERGWPEVTFFWQDPETGLNHRARIDYLQTCGGVDYKTVADVALGALGWQIHKHGYDIQAQLYSSGIKELKRLLGLGKAIIVGDEKQKEWVKAFKSDPENFFEFVFQRSVAPYVFEPIKFDHEILANAEEAIKTARHIFLRCLEEFGASNPWPAGRRKVTELTLYHMPRRIFDRGLKEVS